MRSMSRNGPPGSCLKLAVPSLTKRPLDVTGRLVPGLQNIVRGLRFGRRGSGGDLLLPNAASTLPDLNVTFLHCGKEGVRAPVVGRAAVEGRPNPAK